MNALVIRSTHNIFTIAIILYFACVGLTLPLMGGTKENNQLVLKPLKVTSVSTIVYLRLY